MEHDEVDKLERRLTRGRGGCLRRLIFWLLLVASLVLLLRWVLTASVVVSDVSMYPAVEQGSRLLVWKVGRPDPGDLVLIRLDRGHIVRRVVAGPGATVSQTSSGLEVDGERLPRRDEGEQDYYLVGTDDVSLTPLSCDQATETIGARDVGICVSRQSERPREAVELGPEEYFVRCDNRAFCARRELSEGRVEADRVIGRVVFLRATRDDSDQPFYKRWFGRFESVP